MNKRRNASAIVVLLLLAAVAVFFFVRKHGSNEGSQAASPPEPAKTGNPVEQAAPAPQAPPAAENATGAAPSDESNAGKQAGSGQGSGIVGGSQQPKQAKAEGSKKADEPAAENKEEAKKEEEKKKEEEAKNEASKQAAEAKPAPIPTGNLAASFTDQVGVTYRLVSVSCTLDGVSACGQSHGKSFSMFNRKVEAGAHRLQVNAVYEGAGGPLTYANGYRFTVKSGRMVTVDADRNSQVNVMVHESGGPTTPMEQRLRMAFNVK